MTPYYERDGIVLFYGDSLVIDEWLTADVLVMDPPYGIEYHSNKTPALQRIEGDTSVATRDWALARWAVAGGAHMKPAAVFGSWKAERPYYTRQRLIWDKTDGNGPGMGDLSDAFGNSDEEIYLLGEWPKQGPRQSNVLRTRVSMAALAHDVGHPTPKPIDLMQRLLLAAPPGVVADPFAGSGATLVAAQNLGRPAIGVEIREDYCAVIVERLAQRSMQLEAR